MKKLSFPPREEIQSTLSYMLAHAIPSDQIIEKNTPMYVEKIRRSLDQGEDQTIRTGEEIVHDITAKFHVHDSQFRPEDLPKFTHHVENLVGIVICYFYAIVLKSKSYRNYYAFLQEITDLRREQG